MTERVDLLAGARVLELGDGVAGAAATGLLWALGADVTTVRDVSSPHRRARPRTGMHVSLLAACLDRGKELREALEPDDLERLIDEGFDLVIVDRVHRVRGALAPFGPIDRYVELVDRHPTTAWLTISAFGLTGDRAADPATELTIAAASGMLASVRDERSGQPLKLGGQQSLLNTGQAAALAACHALDLALDDAPVHLDLSAVEATLATGPVLEVGGILLGTSAAGGAKRYGAPASFYRSKDGLVRISAMEEHQWRGVVAAMGSPRWAERFATVDARIEAPDEVDEHVAEWVAGKTKLEAETELQSHGVPATAVYSPAEILDSPQLGHRAAFERLRLDDGTDASVVGLPIRVTTGGNRSRPERRRRRSLRRLRMIEASRVLAVPLCGSLLGALGVDVTKLEDLPRLDMYRRRGPYIEGRAGPDSSAYFALMNHSKSSVGFDVDGDPERLRELVAQADVVIENLGPKRATTLGLGAMVAPREHPDLLAVSSTGFGQDGPHAEYRAYAYNIQASGALGYLTRNRDGESAEINIAWADLISAYSLATIIAAWTVGPKGNAGVGIDFSMTDLVVAHFNEFLAAASVGTSPDDADSANELAPFAPSGVYPTSDGWIALTVDGDEEFGQLATALGAERLGELSAATADVRVECRAALDDYISAATREHRGADLAARLRGEGLLAEAVTDARELVEDPQLTAREFFVTVDHPEWGRRRLVGLPWRQFGRGPIPLGAPPLLQPDA